MSIMMGAARQFGILSAIVRIACNFDAICVAYSSMCEEG